MLENWQVAIIAKMILLPNFVKFPLPCLSKQTNISKVILPGISIAGYLFGTFAVAHTVFGVILSMKWPTFLWVKIKLKNMPHTYLYIRPAPKLHNKRSVPIEVLFYLLCGCKASVSRRLKRKSNYANWSIYLFMTQKAQFIQLQEISILYIIINLQTKML